MYAIVEQPVSLVAADFVQSVCVFVEAGQGVDFLCYGLGEEDAAAAVGKRRLVGDHPVGAFGEGADVEGLAGIEARHVSEELAHVGEEGVIVDEREVLLLLGLWVVDEHGDEIDVAAGHVEGGVRGDDCCVDAGFA